MNNKGFSLVELLATIVILAIVTGITLSVINFDFGKAKKNTEEVFVDTIKDAMDIYLDSDAKKLSFVLVKDKNDSSKDCILYKTHGSVNVYKTTVSMEDVINSTYHPISQSDLVNPVDKSLACANARDISVDIYRDSDFVYYYRINKSSFNCLKNINTKKGTDGSGNIVYYSKTIDNLPEGFSCE